MDMNKPHISAKLLKLVFGNLKSRVPSILKIEYQQFNVKGRPFD
jgi:hypothetical protein